MKYIYFEATVDDNLVTLYTSRKCGLMTSFSDNPQIFPSDIDDAVYCTTWMNGNVAKYYNDIWIHKYSYDDETESTTEIACENLGWLRKNRKSTQKIKEFLNDKC